jgi:surface antigen
LLVSASPKIRGGPTNTRSDDFGHLEKPASDWLTSLGGGVNIYSNGKTIEGPKDAVINCVTVRGGKGGLGCGYGSVPSGFEWQCVELVNRLYLTKGWIKSRWQGNGGDLYDTAPANLHKEHNGSITYLTPGDVIGFSGGYEDFGHVAIVDSINGNTIKIASQNTSSVFNTSLSLIGKTIKKASGTWAGYSIHGVIHRPPTPDEPRYYANKIVQSNADTKAQKTSWYVSPDLKRYWIPDTSTYACLRGRRIVDAGPISQKLLDQLPVQTNSIQLCGTMQPHGPVSGTPTPTATNTPTTIPTVTPTPTHAPSYCANKIVQWDGDTAAQKTSWLVNSELTRYLIPDSSTFDCLKSSGFAFGGAISKTVLDQLPVKNGNSAACGKNALYAIQRLFRGAYLRTSDGNYTLKLQNDGNLVLRASNGAVVWANGKTSDYLVMQGDGNLVTYRFGGTSTWATNTVGTGATKLAVQNGGKLVLYSSSGAAVWDSVHGKL